MWIGPYEVLSELGRGGVGVVHRAIAPSGVEVAVKVLRRASSKEALERFDRERRLLSALGEADGFVPLVDAGETPAGPYLVMPLVPGGTLRDRLARGHLSVDETVALGRELGRALGVAHARGIVHRDLKPENVLYTADGRPLVADLGLAKHFHHDSPGASQSVSLSRTGELRGTAGYMAPEQAADAGAAGPPADVFALGAILYECLTGVRVFEGLSILELIEKIARGHVVPIHHHRPDVPRWLARVVSRALATDPEKRFADGGALARALVEPARSWRPVAIALVLAGATVGILGVRGLHPTTAPPLPEAPELRAHRLVLEAESLIEAGRLDAGLAKAQEALELAPRSSEAWNARALARTEKHELALARADLDRAVALDPRNPFALGNRGNLRSRTGDLDGAIEDCTRAIGLVPGNATFRGERGRVRLDKGDLEGGIADLDRAIELDPRTSSFFSNRSGARLDSGDRAGALADAQRAVERDPRDSVAWGRLARALGENKAPAASVVAATRAIQLDPGNGTAFGDRGAARVELGELDAAIKDFTRAFELSPRDPGALANRGNARLRKGDFAGARADFERYLELAPDNPDASRVRRILASLPAKP